MLGIRVVLLLICLLVVAYLLYRSGKKGEAAPQNRLKEKMVYEVIWSGKVESKNFVLATACLFGKSPKLYELNKALPQNTTHFVYDHKDGKKKIFPYKVL